MGSQEIAIRVEDVSKDFLLPHEKVNSIKSLFTSLTKGLNRTKETQHALKDISFEIKVGEFFGIVGRNGSGKSTLLKILASIYQPTRGIVQTRGKLVPFIELGVGFNPELTGRENVYLNGAMLGFSEAEVDAMYDDIVEFAELERFMDQKLKNYSSGMQVRLAFSMATRSEADILLVDEVLAVGDADFQRKCFEYFRKLKKEAKTVVFVSHDMDAIREYCDRAVLIENSRLINEGKPIDIATQYSRLFMETAGETEDKDGKRWGNGHIKYTKVELPRTIKDEDYLKIDLQAKADIDIEEPVFGFTIRNSSGQPLIGTNSRLARHKIDQVAKGQTLKMTWKIPNIFSDGKHVIDLAIVGADGITACDWWEGATSFTAYKQDRTPYIVTPKMLFEVDA